MKEFSIFYVFFLGIVFSGYTQSGYIIKAVKTDHKVQNKTVFIQNNSKEIKVNNIILFDYVYTGRESLDNNRSNINFYIPMRSNNRLHPNSGIWNDPNMILRRKNTFINLNKKLKKY